MNRKEKAALPETEKAALKDEEIEKVNGGFAPALGGGKGTISENAAPSWAFGAVGETEPASAQTEK